MIYNVESGTKVKEQSCCQLLVLCSPNPEIIQLSYGCGCGVGGFEAMVIWVPQMVTGEMAFNNNNRSYLFRAESQFCFSIFCMPQTSPGISNLNHLFSCIGYPGTIVVTEKGNL